MDIFCSQLIFYVGSGHFWVGLNSIYFETIEKQYKYYTNLSCHGLCLLAVWPGKVGRGGQRRRG